MTRRKGELSPAGIDRGWPHQVALPAAQVTGANYKLVHGFCAGLSFCERRHSVRRGEVGHVVFCFAELLGMAGVPVMRAAAMTAFTYRHAVVRHRRQSRNVPSCGSRRAIRSLNTRSSSRSTFGGNGTCRTIPRLRRLRSLDARNAALDVDGGREREHFGDARAAPSERQAEINSPNLLGFWRARRDSNS